MTHMHHDYWHLPEYPQLLDILQDEVTAASSGKKSVKEALDSAAERQEAAAREGGLQDHAHAEYSRRCRTRSSIRSASDQIVREEYD